jgi:WD40 repeat protein
MTYAITGSDLSTWSIQESNEDIAEAGEVYAVAFSPDSKHFVTGGEDGGLTLWDAQTRKRVRNIPVGERIQYVSFLDANSLLVNTVHRVELWNLPEAKPLGRLAESDSELLAAVAPNRRTVAILERSKDLRILDLKTRKFITKPTGPFTPYALTFAPDNRTIALSQSNTGVVFWNQAGPPMQISGPADARSLVFSPDGSRLFIGYNSNQQIRVWNVRRRQVEILMSGHRAAIKSLIFSPDQARIVSSSDDGTVRIWDAARLQPLVTYDESELGIEAASFSDDGRFLAIAGDDHHIRVLDGSRQQP